MKLEKNMYVRTNSGIRKCEIVDNDGTYKFDDEIYNEDGDALIWLDGDAGELDIYITKASHNIIDLIEVGDYVNGKKVVDKWVEPFGEFAGSTFIRFDGEEVCSATHNLERKPF